MKRKILSIFLFLLLIVWAGVIFKLSGENAEKSTQTSGQFIKKIISVVDSDFKNISEERQDRIVEKLQHPIRKVAHFSAYALFGIISFFMIFCSAPQKWNTSLRSHSFFIGLLLAILYAVTDEYHQSFSSGRSPQVTDVLIDSSGAFCGVVLCLIITTVIMNSLKKRMRDIKEGNENDPLS